MLAHGEAHPGPRTPARLAGCICRSEKLCTQKAWHSDPARGDSGSTQGNGGERLRPVSQKPLCVSISHLRPQLKKNKPASWVKWASGWDSKEPTTSADWLRESSWACGVAAPNCAGCEDGLLVPSVYQVSARGHSSAPTRCWAGSPTGPTRLRGHNLRGTKLEVCSQ